MKPKVINPGEPFILADITYTYQIKDGKLLLSKYNGEVKKKGFIPPTLEEMKAFFKEKGYNEETAIKAFDYYSMGEWKDGKGNPVKNWKQKVFSVWMRDENKIPDKPNGDNPMAGMIM